MTRRSSEDVAALQASLRRVDDLASKGLLREEEAEEQRRALRRRVLQAVVPDEPAPRLTSRARLWALAAMLALVAALSAYVISGRAGLRRQSLEILDAARGTAAQRAAARQQRAGGGLPVAPDERGVFPDEVAPSAAGPAASGADAVVAPLLTGRVSLAPGLAARAAPDDAVFIVVRLAGDPAGLPLAAIRHRVADLPVDFAVREREVVGAAQRFMQAAHVVASARVSKTGTGHPEPGDLEGAAAPVAPWTTGVDIVIDHVLPGP